VKYGRVAGIKAREDIASAIRVDFIANRTRYVLNSEKNPQSFKKNFRHFVVGVGVCNVFIVLLLLGIKSTSTFFFVEKCFTV
jgi:hypothetical protein